MNRDLPIHDGRRIEVVCNGLPLWHAAQLAVDATLVSLVSCGTGIFKTETVRFARL